MPIAFPTLPGLPSLKTYADWPVWADSTPKQVRFTPLSKKAAVQLWHRAREFDRQTKRPGRHGGAIGPTALKILETLLFDFLNYRTGRLDPSYASIARKANVSERTVATALQRLRSLGILHWVRRCSETWQGGRYARAQETNAYAVLPESQWRGYKPAGAEPAAPLAGTWGEHPSLPDVVTQAEAERRNGGDPRDMIRILNSDPNDRLAAALARLGQAVQASETRK